VSTLDYIFLASALSSLLLSIRNLKTDNKPWTVGCLSGFVLFTVVGLYFHEKQEYENNGDDKVYVGYLTPGALLWEPLQDPWGFSRLTLSEIWY